MVIQFRIGEGARLQGVLELVEFPIAVRVFRSIEQKIYKFCGELPDAWKLGGNSVNICFLFTFYVA